MSDSNTQALQKIIRAAQAIAVGEYQPADLEEFSGRADQLGSLAQKISELGREFAARNRQLSLIRKVIPAGVALSAEKDFDRLLETVVIEAQSLTNADGGTLYLLSDKQQLEFVILRNKTLGIGMGGKTGNPMTFTPVNLYDEHGHENRSNIASCAALKGKPVNIADAYKADGFDFSGTKAFDRRSGYHSQSFMTIPLKGTEGQVIGVLQLINAIDEKSGEVIPFESDEVLEALVLLASAALDGYIREEKLRQEIAKLKIEIDETRRKRQVEEITDTAYFRDLKDKARQLREKDKDS
ncbi:MAG: GAF domain-containing protein [Anaerolineales bacterium]|nr:GAF domain-containing protein [Anaerolineales bacterium]